MKLTVSDLDFSTLKLSEEQLSGSRSPGIHVSQIIRHIVTTAGLQKENDFTENDLDQYALVGRLWEQMLADVYYTKPRYERLGEIECDGIVGSPDAFDFQEYSVNEMKACWQSAKNFEERTKFRVYLWQIKSYCWMLECEKAELDVLFIRGDYTTGQPIGRKFVLFFTKQELRENWNMMLRNRDELCESSSR